MELAVKLIVKLCVCITILMTGYYIKENFPNTDEFTAGCYTGITMLGFLSLVDWIL